VPFNRPFPLPPFLPLMTSFRLLRFVALLALVAMPASPARSGEAVAMASPLAQFELFPLIPFHWGVWYADFTNSAFFMVLAVALIVYAFAVAAPSEDRAMVVPGRYQAAVEDGYGFVRNLLQESAGAKASVYFPLIAATFLYILASNMLGMVPYAFTTTSHIAVTLALGGSLWAGINILGLETHRAHFFSLFWPKGAPIVLAPMLVLLELVSYNFRVIALSVRLFANMMAGHALVKILAGFAWSMAHVGGVVMLLSVVPFGVVFILTGLELAVAFLQAYVFTILTCLYLNDALHLH